MTCINSFAINMNCRSTVICRQLLQGSYYKAVNG